MTMTGPACPQGFCLSVESRVHRAYCIQSLRIHSILYTELPLGRMPGRDFAANQWLTNAGGAYILSPNEMALRGIPSFAASRGMNPSIGRYAAHHGINYRRNRIGLLIYRRGATHNSGAQRWNLSFVIPLSPRSG